MFVWKFVVILFGFGFLLCCFKLWSVLIKEDFNLLKLKLNEFLFIIVFGKWKVFLLFLVSLLICMLFGYVRLSVCVILL